MQIARLWRVRAGSDGTGLGLSLVDETIQRYDGGVRIEGDDPEGTIVRIELPLS